MPHRVCPMLATLVEGPFDKPDWVFEIKWDGYRAIAETGITKPALYSRKLNTFHDKFPGIYAAISQIDTRMVLDGEIVALDDTGHPSFQLIQNADEHRDRLMYYVFDLLYLDGYDLRSLPLLERKRLLKAHLPADIPQIRYCDHVPGQGTEFFRICSEQGLEGIIAKKADSPYYTGKRSESWLKIKTQMRQEVVIAGYTEPRGSRKFFGALVLGVYEGDRLTYVGHTGTGFSEKELKKLYNLLTPLETDRMPFDKKPRTNMPVTWVEPKRVCEVAFTEWTGDGSMRHPVYQGLRPDKDAKDVIRETREATEAAVAHAEGLSASGLVRAAASQPIFAKEPPARPGKKKIAASPTTQARREGVNYFSPDPIGRKGEKVLEINGHKVPITRPGKIYWPEAGYKKKDLIDYYRQVAPLILPYLKDRPFVMHRYPEGATHESFYQKDQPHPLPDWVEMLPIWSESNQAVINYLICQNEETLVMLANLGCIEMNPWNSRKQHLDKPDWMVIDLDPEDIGFDKVIEAALETRAVLDRAGAESFCKTSGATGLHIYVPVGGRYDYEIVKDFAHLVAVLVHRRIPGFTSVERSPAKRQKKIYLDYLQNRYGQTLVAPYSVRPTPTATVSTPLQWKEVRKGLRPESFTMETLHRRIDRLGDLWQPVLGPGVDILSCVERLQAELS